MVTSPPEFLGNETFVIHYVDTTVGSYGVAVSCKRGAPVQMRAVGLQEKGGDGLKPAYRAEDPQEDPPLIRNCPLPPRPPYEPRQGPTVGSCGVAVSYKQGTPVQMRAVGLQAMGGHGLEP